MSRMQKTLISLHHFLSFFLFMAILITCCMLLFLNTMSDTMGITLQEQNIKAAASVTFGNVVFLSLICTIIDTVRRKFMVDRPVRQIIQAAEQIQIGNYSVRVPKISGITRADGLEKIADCFNTMVQELSSVETLRTDFIANVSHELKTPIAVIQNCASLLTDTGLDEERRKEYAKDISDASRQLSSLITNILKLNKLENQQVFPTRETFDLGNQLCEAVLSFESVWEEKDLDVEADIQEDVLIETDPELLTLVWNNLLSNAIKFTEPGGTVTVSMEAIGDLVIVKIADTGCGISPEVGAHIFEKFYQGDTSHATQGNGLGLALVKRVVDIVDGNITVSSELGKGSTFTVSIRRKKNG